MRKSAIITYCFSIFLLTGVYGCEGSSGPDDTGKAKTELILGVDVLNRTGAYAVVDNPGRTVTAYFTASDSDKNGVQMKVSTADNVAMYDPETSEAVYDLETKPEIWVRNNGHQIKYQVVVEVMQETEKVPVVSVEILNKFECTAEVDNKAKSITLSMTPNELDLHDVKMKVVLGEDYTMYSPKTEEAVYDLTRKKELWVQSGAKQLRYVINVNTVQKRDEIDPTKQGWTNVSASFGTLPEGITVYKSPAQMSGKNTIAYITKIDMNVTGRDFSILGGYQTGEKTPSAFCESSQATVIMNASYFFWNTTTQKMTTIGLVVSNGKTLVTNIQGSTRNGPDGTPTIYNPTRAVFSLSKSGSLHADWVWSVTADMHYAYPRPADVHPGQAPAKYPDKNYPAGGWVLDAQEAVSAGPLLLRNGEVYNTWEEEIWDEIGGTNATSNVPRSVVGVTSNRQLILFACEGRNITPGVPGLTTLEVANILKGLGCVDAVNMDGGGSVCMLVNGKETVKPSGNGIQRAVMTAIAIK